MTKPDDKKVRKASDRFRQRQEEIRLAREERVGISQHKSLALYDGNSDEDEWEDDDFLGDEWEEPLVELPVDAARQRFFDEVLLSASPEDAPMLTAVLEEVWGLLPALISETGLLESSDEVLARVKSKLPAQDMDEVEAQVVHQIERLLYAIPPEAQEPTGEDVLRVRADFQRGSTFIPDYELLNYEPRFPVTRADRDLVATLKRLDQRAVEYDEVADLVESTIAKRLGDWLRLREADDYFIKRVELVTAVLFDAYGAPEPAARYSFAGTSAENLVDKAKAFSLMSLAFAHGFIYVPFLFHTLLCYLEDIGYATFHDEIHEELQDLQDEMLSEIRCLEGHAGYLSRERLLAAELYSYSFENYHNHRGNFRFDWLMPREVRILENQSIDDESAARLMEMPVGEIPERRKQLERAIKLVDAPGEAAAFREGVRQSLQRALAEGLTTPESQEALIEQICYRASDFLYLIRRNETDLKECSEDLRRDSSPEDDMDDGMGLDTNVDD